MMMVVPLVAIIISALVLAVRAQSTTSPDTCTGTNYVLSGGRCYRLISANNERERWYDAIEVCANEDASIVTVGSETVTTYLETLCSSASPCWIGLYQLAQQNQNQYQWESGEPFDYEDWASQQPSHGVGNGNGGNNKYRACVYFGDGDNKGHWYDEECTQKYPFVCEKAASCPAGYYLSQEYVDAATPAVCTQCPGGTYRSTGGGVGVEACTSCAAGKVGLAGRTSVCTDDCPQGYYCPTGSSIEPGATTNAPLACPTGTYGPAAGKKVLDDCKQCDPGYYCAGTANTVANPSDALCTAGRCGFAGQNTTSCAQDCPAGYVCPAGSACPGAVKWDESAVTNGAQDCGGASVYCPVGSAEVTYVDAGYYSTGGTVERRTGQSECEPGYYCTSGVRATCPGGTYGDSSGAESQAECPDCDAGYICPTDRINTSPQSVNCYNKAILDSILPGNGWDHGYQIFCPAGSALPTEASAGYYTTPTGSQYVNNRQAQAECASDEVCSDGLRSTLLLWSTATDCGTEGAAAVAVDEMTDAGFLLDTFTASINENATATYDVAYSIGTVDYYDPSEGSCAPDTTAKNLGIFALDAASGELELTRDDLQFEVCLPNLDIRYTVPIVATVTTTDGEATVVGTLECPVTVTVNDVNDQPVFIDYDAEGAEYPTYYRQITEAVQQNIPVETCTSSGYSVRCPTSISGSATPELTAEDEDDGSVLTYAIVEDNDGLTTDNTHIFKIDPCSGLVSTRQAYQLNYNQKQTYSYTISVTDDGNGGLFPEKTAYATLIIYVIDVNDAPVWVYDESVHTLEIAENEPEDTEVSGISLTDLATDADNDELVFQIYTNDGDAFKIVDGKLLTTRVGADTINYESSKTKYYLVIEAQDNRGGSVTGTITITVVNANDPPSLASSTRSFYVLENAAGSTACEAASGTCSTPGAITATDEDNDVTSDDLTSFSLLDDADGAFSIDDSTGVITVNDDLDFEDVNNALSTGSGRGYIITVQATSDGGTPGDTSDDESVEASVTIYIVDVNEDPEGQSLTISVPETWPVGAALPEYFTATDPDNADLVLLGETAPQQTLTYSNGDSNAYWTISTSDDNRGVAKVASSLVGAYTYGSSWPISVRVQDNGGPTRGETTYSVYAVLLDMNEAPNFDAATTSLTATENADFTSDTIYADDSDADDVLSYEVVGGNGAVFFTITDGDGTAANPGFKVQKRDTYEGTSNEVVLDYELASKEWTLKIRVSDQGPSAMTGQFCEALSSDEPCGGGAYCESGRCTQICYDTEDGTLAETWQGMVGPDTFYMCPYDYAGSTSPFMDPSYIDGVESDFYVETADLTLVVTIQDANDPPAFSNCSLLSYQVVANRAEQDQTVVNAGVLDSLTSDEDTSAAFNHDWTYSFTIVDDFFSIASGNAVVYTAADNAAGELTVGDVYTPTIRVTDATDSGVYSECTMTITVIDQNSPPSMDDYTTATLNEDADTSTEIVLLESMISLVTDADDGESFTFTTSSNSYFTVDASTGRLTVGSAVVSYESLDDPHEYELIVRVRDSKGAEDVATITIPIGDVNEQPRFTTVLPTITVDENTPAGTSILGDLEALSYVSDPDVDAVDTTWRELTFSLESCSETTCPFAVDSEDGSITVTAALDYENDPTSFELTIRAADGPGLFALGVFKVEVADVNEAPVFGPNPTVLVNESSTSSGTELFNMKDVVTDEDADDGPENLEFTVVTMTDYFEIVDGILQSKNNFRLDYEDTRQYAVEISVSDGEFTDSATVTVNVQNRNDVQISGVAVSGDGALACGGGTEVTISGANFGLVDNTVLPATLAVAYTNTRTGASYACENPTRGDADNTEITCEAAAGVGAGFTWTVEVAVAGTQIQGDVSAAFSTPALAYEAPALTAVSNATALPTRGGQQFSLQGTCMGSASDYAAAGGFAQTPDTSVRYCSATGACVEPTGCAMDAAGAVVCESVPSLGGSLRWTVVIAGTTSAALLSGSHAVPEVTALSRAEFPADGDAGIVISGDNFGPGGAVPDEAYALLTFNTATAQYDLLDCTVTTAYEEITCSGIDPGMGADMPVMVAFGGLVNIPSLGVSFEEPVITGLSGEAVSSGSTVGGQQIVVSGSGFGPACGRAATNDAESEPCETMSVAYSRGSLRAYGSNAGSIITYAPDCVVVTNTRIVCSTTPGTGAGHVWTFNFGGHTGVSPPEGVTTSYAAPTVGAYEGAGADDALTSGGQTVLISGSNFGPANGAEIRAFYGPEDDPLEFGDPSSNLGILCEIETINEVIRCTTVEGAGDELTWTVYVDGQESHAETTSYGAPSISDLSLTSFDVDGGEVVLLTGLNFGPAGRQEYLEDVTYGPIENAAAYSPDCDIVGHTSLRCTTVAGFGEDMSWTVTIKGQASPASTVTTSYTPLSLGDVTYNSRSTQGGYLMYLEVDGLPVCDSQAIISIVFGEQTLSYTNLYDDALSSQPIGDADAYCASSATRGQRMVSFTVPELASADRTPSVGIQVQSRRFDGSYATALVDFEYASPRLDSVYAEAVGGASSSLYVVLRGANFCRNNECCQTLVNGIEATEISHTHDMITLNVDSDGATVQIQCGDRLSELKEVSTRNPYTYAAKTLSGVSVANVVYPTYIAPGTELIELSGLNYGNALPVVYVGDTEATVVSHKNQTCGGDAPSIGADGQCYITTIEVPSGQGSSNGITVVVASSGAQSTPNALFEFVGYEAPAITSIAIVDGAQPVATTGGQTLRITGTNFGTYGQVHFYQNKASTGSDVTFESYPALVGNLTCTPWDHSELECEIPAGEGYDLEILVVSDDQNSRVSGIDPQFTLSYAAPVVTEIVVDGSLDISAARTIGGDRITLHGSNFGRPYESGSACADLLQPDCTLFKPVVSLGGLSCEFESNTDDTISCLVPPGQGANLAIAVTVRSQTAVSSLVFSYAAPEVSSFTPLTAPTSGRVDGNAIMMEIFGDNFGIDDLEVRFIATDGTIDLLAVARSDDTDASLYPLFEYNHTYITFQVPAYRGKDLRVVVDAAGQRGEASELFSYNKPTVSAVAVMDPDDPSEFNYVSEGATVAVSTSLLPTSYEPGLSLQENRRRFLMTGARSAARTYIDGGRSLADAVLRLPSTISCEVSSLHRGYSWLTTAYTVLSNGVFYKSTDLFLNEYCSGSAAVTIETRGGVYENLSVNRTDAGCATVYRMVVDRVDMTPQTSAGMAFLIDNECCGGSSFWSVGETEVCACDALAANRALVFTGAGHGIYLIDDLNDWYFSAPVDSAEELMAQAAFDFPRYGPTVETVDERTLGDTLSGPTSGCYEYEDYDTYRARRDEAILLYGSALDVYRKCETKAIIKLEGENFSSELLNTTNSQELEVIFVNLETGEEFRAATPSSIGDHNEECTIEDGCEHTDDEIKFQVPPGSGMNLVILLRVGNQETYAESTSVNATATDARIRFNYFAPTVSRVTPGSLWVDSYEFADAAGDQSVNVRGDNFGGVKVNTTIYVDGRMCPGAEWRSSDEDLVDGLPFLSCTPDADVVGPRNLFVCVSDQVARVGSSTRDASLLMEADRVTRDSNSSDLSTEDQSTVDTLLAVVSSQFNTRCVSISERSGNVLGFYGGLGQLCVECPSGAVCEKGDAYLEDPDAASGFYRLDVAVFEDDGTTIAERAQTRCPSERWDSDLVSSYPSLILDDTCSDYVACQPAEACMGANVCSEGYQYAYDKCTSIRSADGYNNSCGVVLNPFTGVYEGVDSDCNPDPSAECTSDNPEQCAKCVVSLDGEVSEAVPVGTCECTMPQRCALCTLNTHYRLNNKCQECPASVWVIALGFAILVFVAIVSGYYFNKYNLNLALLAIGVDFAQVLSVFSSVDIEWPPAFEKFLNLFSFLSFNIDIIGIECVAPNFEYETKWWLSESMPLVVLGVLIFMHLLYSAYKIVRQTKRTKLTSHVARLVAIYLVVCYVLYIAVTRKALEIFDCTALPESDGYTYTSFTSMSCDGGSLCRCGEPGGVQQRLAPLAAFFLVLYTVGFPAFVYVSIRRHRALVEEDQYLRAHGVGDTRESGPRTYDFRKSFSTLYVSFKPHKQTWVVLIILRKALIAMCALLLRTNVTAVLAMVLMILFASFVLTSLYRPYMSNGERVSVLKELDDLATKGLDDPKYNKYTVLQRRVQEAVKVHRTLADRKRANQHGATHFNFDDSDKMLEQLTRRNKRRRSAAEFFFDYNSVELALLGSAILICLGGILLESMEGDSNLDSQRGSLSVLLIVVIILTIIYYFVAILSEVFPSRMSAYTRFLQRRSPDDRQIENLDDDLDLSTNPIFFNGQRPPAANESEENARLRSELGEQQEELDKVLKHNAQLREELRTQKREEQRNDDGTNTRLPPSDTDRSRRKQFSFRVPR